MFGGKSSNGKTTGEIQGCRQEVQGTGKEFPFLHAQRIKKIDGEK